MDCKFDEMLLYEYLDDTLDSDESLIVSNHLSLCSECRKKIAEIKLLYYEIEHLDEVIIPKEIADIRSSIVNQAFTDGHSFTKRTYIRLNSSYKKSKKTLRNAPLIGSMMISKEKTANFTKGIYNVSKKVYKATKKEKQKPDKKKFKGLGDLL